MSGHSKWSTIKRQKAVTDARRSAVFTKYARLITVAARLGGGDPDMNFRLRLAIDQARSVNMPNDNIDRAVKAGTGANRSDQTKEVLYEGFGPGGAAVLVEAITDNPNRTSSDVRKLFSDHGGSMGGQNSVRWMFEQRGLIRLKTSTLGAEPENFVLAAVDAGASDYTTDENEYILYVQPNDIARLRAWLEAKSVPVERAGVEFVPTTMNTISADDGPKLESFLASLDEHPDVTNVVTNAT